MSLAPGTLVSNRHRWPMSSSHPDCWGEPHMGTVLAVNDPESWANTLAFSGRTPSQGEVDEHLAKLKAEGVEVSDTPVRWAFGVMWETEVRPYAEVYKAWKQARCEAYAKIPREQGLTG